MLTLAAGNYEGINIDSDMLSYGLDKGYCLQTILGAVRSESFLFVLPIFSALPYCSIFLEEKGFGYLKVYLPRSGRGNYIAGKVIGIALGSGICTGLSFLIYSAFVVLSFGRYEIGGLLLGQFLMKISKQFILLFFIGMIWGSIGSISGVFFESRYMAYAGPFMVCYLLIIITTRYVKAAYICNPREWILLQHGWGSGGYLIYVFLAAVSIALFTIESIMLWRKVRCR